MKRFLKYLPILVLVAAGSWLGMVTFQTYQVKKETVSRIQFLQHCSFEPLNGGQIFIDQFNPAWPTVLLYFHPECGHCQYEASEIGKRAELFEKANMILITPDDSLPRIESFASQYQLWRIDNLTVLIDRNFHFRKYFGTSVIPSAFIYGADKRLHKSYKGEIKIEAIVNALKP